MHTIETLGLQLAAWWRPLTGNRLGAFPGLVALIRAEDDGGELLPLPHSLAPEVTGDPYGWDVHLLPGAPGPDDSTVIDEIRELVERCVPWVRLFLAPRVGIDLGDDDDFYASENGVIAIAYTHPLRTVLRATHVACWHVAEHELTSAEIESVEVLTRHSRHYSGEILFSLRERRARLYASWAEARDQGWPIGDSDADQAFSAVYTGQLAAGVRTGRLAPELLAPATEAFDEFELGPDQLEIQPQRRRLRLTRLRRR